MNTTTNPMNPTDIAAATRDTTAVSPADALLGESPLWDDENERLLRVDLWRGHLHAKAPETGIAPIPDGIADGITVDADGAVRVALAGDGATARYSPTGPPTNRMVM